MRVPYLSIFLFFAFAIHSVAAPKPSVKVKGASSLKKDALVEMSGLEQDPNLPAKEVKERLETSGLFSKVTVRRNKNFVAIDVNEKSNWFIVPYFSSDQESKIFGAAFGKSSLFAEDRSLFGRFQAGTDDREGSLLFREESIANSAFQLGLSLDYEDALHRVFRERTVVQKTDNYYFGGSVQAGYRVTPDITLGFNNYLESHRFEELDGKRQDGFQWSHKILLDFDRFFSNEGLSDGVSARVYFEATNPASAFTFQKTGIFLDSGIYQHGNFNWIIRNRMERAFGAPRYQLFELGGYRLRGFPSQIFRDKFYASTQNDFLLASWPLWKTILRPLVFLDWAFAESSGRTGTGGGIQVFFRNVAIPAVQIFAGYGFHPDGFSMAASIGPQF